MDTVKQMDKWNTVNWKTVERKVFKLQKRIYRASQSGNVKLVHKLQRLLISSYYARLLAVRKVTQDNQGKKTAGIDGVKSLTQRQRLEMVKKLELGDEAKPTRRVWIPKPHTEEKRPLGIPTMYDRCTQALVKLALEPEWEAKFEENSYGFRPSRSTHDAIEAIFNAIRYKPKYVLDADISKCFDKINHSKLLEKLSTYPSLRRQVKAWLKSGVIDKTEIFETTEGTPQGGVASPLLANIALHGMEQRIKEYADTLKGTKRRNRNALSLIRYADDFVILHPELKVVEKCQEIIENWLNEYGLKLNKCKTRITHSLQQYGDTVGFDFLGFYIRQFPVGKHQSGKDTKGRKLGFKTIIKPSDKSVETHILKLGETIKRHRCVPQRALIAHLNPIIRGWTNYYATVCSKDTFSYCGYVLYNQLRRWAIRRHPSKGKKWITEKYWHHKELGKWVFSTGEDKLLRHNATNIVRHTKVKANKSIFDGDLYYWSSRLGKHPEMPKGKARLLKKQKGKCTVCNLHFKDGDLMEIDHIRPKSKGGNDSINNKQLLHRHCHHKKTTYDGSHTRTSDKGSNLREAV